MSRNFTARIVLDTSIDAPTVVYAMTQGRGEAWYPDGYNFDIYDDAGNPIDVEAEGTDDNHLCF